MARAKRIGLMLWPVPGLEAGFERGLWAEQNGYDDLWLPDAEGLQDPITFAAALGTVTKRVRLCTGIVPVFNRPPPVLATSVIAAEQRAPGRFVLGLGASTSNMIERWYGLHYERPLTRVRETIELLRQILAGRKTAYAGTLVRSHGFQLKECPSVPVPIHLGAIGPKMLELAGELADGVILNDFTPPDRYDWAFTHIDTGAKRAGRRLEDIELVRRRAFYVTNDPAAALDKMREHIAFYGSAPAYQEVMIRLGYGAAVDAIRAAYAVRDRAQVHRAIDDAMVRRIFTAGTAAQCRDSARADFAAGIETLVVSPQAATAEAFSCGAEAFSRAEFRLDPSPDHAIEGR